MSQSSGIHLCHRRFQSSTTSDIHHSTSATADTVATSAEFITTPTSNSRQNSVDDAMQKCGLCALLSRLLRRAMCVGSRRGSAESYYQELAETANPFQPSESSTMKSSTHGGGVYVCLIPSTDQENQRKSSLKTDKLSHLLEHDIQLINALDDDKKNENFRRNRLSNGRFLTMHKRRRKKLQTRSLLQDPAMLDDVLHGQVKCILNQAGNWRFNAFTLETVTGGRSLPVLCVHLFHWYGLLDHFNLDVVRLWKLFTLIEEGYHSTNPYHNSIHATDVTQAMHCFLQERKILENLQPIEIMASLLGAVTHDLDHPGVNQPFLIATSNHLAALYENISVLENHHWRSAVGCLLESGVAEQIYDIRPIVEKQIASLILATDITRQTEFLTKFRNLLDTNTLDMKLPENRHFILQISLKCADISNPCRPWDISKKWSQKVCEEFFRQGDYERQLNLPVTSLCDRFSNSVPKIQVGFFKYVVTPLFDEWHKFLNTNLSTKMIKYLKENEIQWEKKVAAELAEETKTEISDAEMLDVEEEMAADDDDEEENDFDKSNSSEVLLPEVPFGRRSSLQVPKFIGRSSRYYRRYSVPVNPPKIVLQTEYNQGKSNNSIIQENIQEYKFEDSLSILSSGSENEYRKSSMENSCEHERPLSAENLVPELNIATMSNSDCADRLNIVMHRSTNFFNMTTASADSVSKQLIRQQTFPPLQPYIRTRYLSATAEMSGPTTFIEYSESQPDDNFENTTIGLLPSNSKQELFQSEKSHKIVKLSLPCQKENLDPTKIQFGNSNRGRRSSAPIDTLNTAPKNIIEPHYSFDSSIRRGSVPVFTVHMPITEGKVEKPFCSTMTTTTAGTTAFQRRRGSVPFDNISATVWESAKHKSRNNKKFKRRSSGGPEILTPILTESDSGNGSQSNRRHKRTDHQKSEVESLLNRRRGSLPIEVLSVSHTATLRH